MLRKSSVIALAAMIALLLIAAPALAQEAKKYAVLPFTYNGPQKYGYFPKAFQASLGSDLEWPGHVEPASDDALEGLATPKSQADALKTLQGGGLDYVVSGTISILEKEATITLQAFGVDGSSWKKKGQMGIDEITPWLDEQGKAIMGDLFHRPGYSTAEKEKKDIVDKVNAPTNSAFIQATGNGGAQSTAATLNPQFRYEGGTENIGRWRSQTLRFFSTSMVVGDADGDGQNEVFILHKTGISAYRYKDGKLQPLETLKLTPSTQYIRAELVDVDKDKIPEIVIGTYQSYYKTSGRAPEGWAKSHILSFKGGKFKFLVQNYNRFLGILKMPPTYMPILVTQKKGQRSLFDSRINEAFYKDGEIILGQSIPTPPMGNVYSMTYLPDGMGYKFAVIDDFHRLKIYSQTMERLSSSDTDKYNSSGIGIEMSERPAGMGPGIVDDKTATYNVPFRMIAASLTKKGKYELLVNKDLSAAAQVFERFNYYSQGEIHALSWDGVGMGLAWKTRRIKGQVSDIGLADLNNDGKKQLVVLVNTFPGGMGFTKRKTVLLAYELNN